MQDANTERGRVTARCRCGATATISGGRVKRFLQFGEFVCDNCKAKQKRQREILRETRKGKKR